MIRAAAFLFVLILFSASGCARADTERWYQQSDVSAGKTVFLNHCAGCHGERAQGLATDWKQRQADGSFPPPPLNGTAHAWHHSLPLLLKSINEGGAAYGGKMPAFGDRLGDDEKRAVIAYFQSFWSDEIYARWREMHGH